MNHLYYNADSSDGASVAMLISPGTIAKALQGIYNGGKGRNGTYISPELFRAVADLLRLAESEGVELSSAPDPDDDFRHALSHADDVFAAFKVHRMQRDMGRMLTDSNGDLKPFKQWANEVLPIASHQCGAWLRTEYDTAVLRAHQAADWQQFVREADVLPNLKWMPSTSINPGTDHMPFWNTVRPVDDPFWDEHRPGDRWNCKCSLTSTDEPCTPAPHSDKASEPQPGLSSNPGTDRAVFSQDHPYFPESCSSCSFYKPGFKDKLRNLFTNRAKDCYNCPYINGCLPGEKKVAKQRQAQQKAATHIKEFRATLDPFNGATVHSQDFVSGNLTILRRSMQDVYEHNREDLQLMKWLEKFDLSTIRNWKYEGWAENRPYAPSHSKYDPNNPNRRKHPETEYFLYYSLKIGRKKYWANVKMHKDYGEVLYTIEKKKPDDLIPGLKQ